METVQVFVLGGTPTTSTFRTVVHLAIAVIATAVAYVTRDSPLTLPYLAGAGFCLSVDIIGMATETYLTLTGSIKHVDRVSPSMAQPRTTTSRKNGTSSQIDTGIDSAYSSNRYSCPKYY